MKIVLAQQNYHIGNFERNTEKIIGAIEEAKGLGADLVVFSELGICGYPPRDFLEFEDFIEKCYESIDRIREHADTIGVLVGAPSRNKKPEGKDLFNAAFLLYEKEIKGEVHKSLLPTYDVFDEYRYFEPAFDWNILEFKGKRLAVTICEDIWDIVDNPLYRLRPMDKLVELKPDMMINLSASPFDYIHEQERKAVIKANVLKYQLPMVYSNCVGSQTEIVFDGGSLVFDKSGNLCRKLPSFAEAIECVTINDDGSVGGDRRQETGDRRQETGDRGEKTGNRKQETGNGEMEVALEKLTPKDAEDAKGNAKSAYEQAEGGLIRFARNDGGGSGDGSFEEEEFEAIDHLKPNPTTFDPKLNIEGIYKTLVMGIGDYFSKMNFKKAILGSSGGIDSAVTIALACEALGAENVYAVLMPSPYSSEHSVTDAVRLSENIGNPYEILKIKDIYEAFLSTLKPLFKDLPFSLAEENIQSRSRGNLLMSIANKFGYILLNTSNKSELATGYGTLYGDMAGGLGVLGDCYKQQVYALAEYINRDKEIIPDNIIHKAPSAELRPEQKDSDSLPEYSILDQILYQYIERRKGPKEIKEQGFDGALVDRVLKLVNTNEYKRNQFCPIIRVSPKAFGVGRRVPIVAKYLA